MQTRQKHVATIVCQIEEIDSAFGTLNIANPTLIDSGADVNVMPYDIFNQLLDTELVPTPGALSSFVGENANCIGYADIEVRIKQVSCPHRFHILAANYTTSIMSL